MSPTPKPNIEAFLNVVQKLPFHRGVTFRGYRHTQTPPQTVVTQALTDTTTDPRVATVDFSTEGLYLVLGQQGRSLTAFSADRTTGPVVFLPATVFSIGHTLQLPLPADRQAPGQNRVLAVTTAIELVPNEDGFSPPDDVPAQIQHGLDLISQALHGPQLSPDDAASWERFVGPLN